MKIVIDTNVFVSALIRPSNNFLSLIDYIDRKATVLYSTEILAELVDVLQREKFAKYTTTGDVAKFVTWVASTGELVPIDRPPAVGSRDPDDDKFLALAMAGQADFLITGDKDLLVLEKIGTTPIVSPTEFLKLVER